MSGGTPELWVAVAGFGGAMMNAMAGGGTMLTFPALLAAGLPPVLANTTSTVALGMGMPGSVWAFRRHLPAIRPWIVPLGLASVLGGVAGGVLLLALPSRVFDAVVPWLLLLATVLFVLNEPIVRWLKRRPAAIIAAESLPGAAPAALAGRPRAAGIAFQALVGLYGGYFGAGIGIMMMASLSLLGLRDINRLNALKSVLALLANGASILYFIARGQVDWPLAAWLMAGSVPGYVVGARLAQRIPARAVRLIAATIGIGMAVSFWVKD